MIYFYVYTSFQSNERTISRAFHSLNDMINNVRQFNTYWFNDCSARFYCEDDGVMEINRIEIMTRM